MTIFESVSYTIVAVYYIFTFFLPVEGNIETAGTDTPAGFYAPMIVVQDRCGDTTTGTVIITIKGRVSLYR